MLGEMPCRPLPRDKLSSYFSTRAIARARCRRQARVEFSSARSTQCTGSRETQQPCREASWEGAPHLCAFLHRHAEFCTVLLRRTKVCMLPARCKRQGGGAKLRTSAEHLPTMPPDMAAAFRDFPWTARRRASRCEPLHTAASSYGAFPSTTAAPKSACDGHVSSITPAPDSDPYRARRDPSLDRYALAQSCSKSQNLDFRARLAAEWAVGGGRARCRCALRGVEAADEPSSDRRDHRGDVRRAAGNAIFRVSPACAFEGSARAATLRNAPQRSARTVECGRSGWPFAVRGLPALGNACGRFAAPVECRETRALPWLCNSRPSVCKRRERSKASAAYEPSCRVRLVVARAVRLSLFVIRRACLSSSHTRARGARTRARSATDTAIRYETAQ